jgi:hypothetical protein
MVNRKAKVAGDFRAGSLGDIISKSKRSLFTCKQPGQRKRRDEYCHVCTFIQGTDNEVCTSCGFTRPIVRASINNLATVTESV